MSISIFNNLIGGKEFCFQAKNQNIETALKEISYYVSDGTIKSKEEKEIYYGKINDRTFSLNKKRLLHTFGMDMLYNVKGITEENRQGGITIKYKFNLINFNFKHFVYVVMPTLILIYILSNYEIQYQLFSLLYFVTSDFLLNVKKRIRINGYHEHFDLFLKSVLQTRI
ncbi:hypothetical protein SAMN02927921_04270 [Sinomicrobium oceani]|uniref:Uncharacterized protein n=1 Tax=Sinomicrobium oceani TaxID=1150368 RepID=A0A1K1S0Y0_9FLAO|nr:hypothetical protein [Sinomicrobium oceani]SFW77810.1 hypothetical protein SAMN02927921_04270 [Sinomicrobium oceani]